LRAAVVPIYARKEGSVSTALLLKANLNAPRGQAAAGVGGVWVAHRLPGWGALPSGRGFVGVAVTAGP
jgi:hypothetical protein